MTVVVALTGGIASGKTTLALFAENKGIPVFYADKIVYELYKTRLVQSELKTNFPYIEEITIENVHKIVQQLATNIDNLIILEKIIHPLVAKEVKTFINKAIQNNIPLVLLEVPLLFQSGINKYCDYIITLSLPEKIQQQRALQRSNMTKQKFQLLNERQKNNFNNKADFIIDTSCSITKLKQNFTKIILKIKGDINGSKNS